MNKLPLDIFYMSCMLKDKLLATHLSDLTKKKVERMETQSSGPLINLYKLSYRQHHIIDTIYLGNAYNACNYEDLKSDNIGLIVNITEEIPNYYPEDFEYYNIITKDDNDHHVKEFLTDSLEYINNFEKKKSREKYFSSLFYGL